MLRFGNTFAPWRRVSQSPLESFVRALKGCSLSTLGPRGCHAQLMPDDQDPKDRARRSLLDSLDAQREHVIGILDGLTDEQLAESKLPSGWSFIGMLQHLTFDDEYYWFSCIFAGESLEFFEGLGDDPDAVFKASLGLTGEEAVAQYRKQIARSNEVIAAMQLDDPAKARAPWWDESETWDLYDVLLHVLTETACHAGHLDAARELVDGRKWMSLSDAGDG